MPFNMSSPIRLNLDQSKVVSCGNRLIYSIDIFGTKKYILFNTEIFSKGVFLLALSQTSPSFYVSVVKVF